MASVTNAAASAMNATRLCDELGRHHDGRGGVQGHHEAPAQLQDECPDRQGEREIEEHDVLVGRDGLEPDRPVRHLDVIAQALRCLHGDEDHEQTHEDRHVTP